MQNVADYNHLKVELETRQCGIPEDERSRMQAELERLGWAVDEFPASQLELKIVYHPKSAVYHAQAKLKLPGHTIVTGHQSQWLDDAVMRTIARLMHRVDRYKEHPDREAVDQAARQAHLARDVIAPVDPDAGEVGEAAQRQDYGAFRRALAGHEAWVRTNVGRWLQRYPEVTALIGDAFDTDDFVEEVFLMAFEGYAERPTGVAIHEWLRDFIDPAVQALWHEPEEREAASYARSIDSPPGG